jgi:hypothetical protein
MLFLWRDAYNAEPLLSLSYAYAKANDFAASEAALVAALRKEPRNQRALDMLTDLRKLRRAQGKPADDTISIAADGLDLNLEG